MYTRHNEASHNTIIGFTEQPQTVFDAYHRLGVSRVNGVATLGTSCQIEQEVIDDHRAIIEAFEHRSLDDAMRVITRRNENAKKTIRRAIVAAGDQL